VLWVTDLALLLGLPVAHTHTQQYKLVLLQVHRVLLGLRVEEIEGIVSAPPENIQSPPAHIPKNLLPFLKGCILQGNEVLLTLNAEAILQAPALK
jgi:twitching motility protein PilI